MDSSPLTSRFRGIVRLVIAGAGPGELVPPLLGAIGAVERWSGARRSRVRDPLIAAVLFAAAGREVERVARSIAAALLAAGDGSKTAPELAAGTDPDAAWAGRLEGWRHIGTTGVMADLATWLLAEGEPLPAPSGGLALGEPETWPLQAEARNGCERRVVDAASFRGLEREVRWIPTPTGTLGLVGGRPVKVLGGLLYGGRALRFEHYGEELLLPVGLVRVGSFR